MNSKRKQSFFTRALVLVIAFAMALLMFPANALTNLFAYAASGDIDHTFITIGKSNEEVKTTVVKGGTYTIPKAYIGGDESFEVGDKTKEGSDLIEETTTLDSSSVTVTYNGAPVEINEVGDPAKSKTFKANNIGTYTIEYAYTVTDVDFGTQTYRFTLQVYSSLSSATINFDENDEKMFPSVIDAWLLKDKNLYLAEPTVLDKNGEEIFNEVTDQEGSKSQKKIPVLFEGESVPQDITDYVEVSVFDPVANGKLTYDADAESPTIGKDEKGLYIANSTLKQHSGVYKVTYSYYKGGQFVISTTRETRVYADKDEERYYKDKVYEFTAKLATSWSDNAQTGVEAKLPAAVGQTSANTNPSNESIDVFYKIKVRYKATRGDAYEYINANETRLALYNKDEDHPVFDEDGYLIDSTKFTPLENGNYEFIYEVTDFYGTATKTIGAGTYEFTDVKDQTSPTVVVYDASVVDSEGKPTYESATYKSKTYSYPNSVIVYAIHIDDNVSTDADISKEGSKMEIYRDIKTSSTTSIYTIREYNDKNLVFNYRATNLGEDGEIKAYANLQTYNYLIRKQTSDVDSDAKMLQWLNKNGYMIVVDNNNYEHIYNIFKNEDKLFKESDQAGQEINPLADKATKEDALTWFKSAAAEEYGFAYLDMDFTFGATSAEGGQSATQYYIQYFVKDEAQRTSSTTLSMRVSTDNSVDYEAPTITFNGTFSDYYLPTAVVKFNNDNVKPDDNRDTNMVFHALYRYLDESEKPIILKDKEVADFDGVVKDIDAYAKNAQSSGAAFYKKLQDDKAKFLTKDTNLGYGYYELDEDSTYSIDLKESGDNSKYLQILIYVYDDEGNINLYTKESKILNEKDNLAPQFLEYGVGDIDQEERKQYNDVEIPYVSISDDLIDYVSFDVKVEYLDGDKRLDVAASGIQASRQKRSDGYGTLALTGGKFNASFAGTYQISVSFTDIKNRTIVKFYTLDVDPRAIVQEPSINTTLASQTLEIEDLYTVDDNGERILTGIEIPNPTVEYSISNSVTEDVFFNKNGEINKDYKDPTLTPQDNTDGAKYNQTNFVVIGADENKNSTNWIAKDINPEGIGEVNVGNIFKFDSYETLNKKSYQYQIVYETTLIAYNYHNFEYVNNAEILSDRDLYTFKGKVKDKDDSEKDVKVSFMKENKYFIIVGEDDATFIAEKQKDGSYQYFDENELDYSASDVDQTIVNNIFDNILSYQRQTKPVYITVQDSREPKISDAVQKHYDDIMYLSIDDLKERDNKIDIHKIESDATDIAIEKCSISISYTLANGRTGSGYVVVPDSKDPSKTVRATGEDLFGDKMFYDGFGSQPDGTYTITYTVKDKFDNTTTKDYTIKIGDTTGPAMTIPDGFLKDTYDIKDASIMIDLDLLKAYDAVDGEIDVNEIKFVSLKYVSVTPTKECVALEKSTDRVKYFDLTEVGNYELTVEVKDKAGNTETRTIKFEVTATAENPVPVYQIVGTVLIVISVLLLAGVIIYFIVSKVKLDKELKK